MKTHVILCTHNGEKYIQEQIESILLQSLVVDYIHVYDFSSQDKTINIVKTKFKKNKNIFIKSNLPAHGAAKSFFFAFNDLLHKIKDEDFVFIADQDDVWFTDKVKTILKIFQDSGNNKELMIAHDVRVVNSDLEEIAPSFYTGDPYLLPRDLTTKRLILCNPIIGHTMGLPGRLLRMICQNISVDNYLMHDWAISMFCHRYAQIAFHSQPLSLYRQHDSNLLGSNKKINIFSKIKRTYFFSQRLLHQAKQLGLDINRIDKKRNIQKKEIKYFLKISNNSTEYWKLPILLAWYSLSTGPTLKRRLLSLFLLINALFSRLKN